METQNETKTRRAVVAALATGWLMADPLYFDTETTGVKTGAQLVEAALVDARGAVVFNRRVKPTIPMPADATAINQISEADLAGLPSLADLWPELREALRGRLVIVYNADFDTRILRESLDAHRITEAAPWRKTVCAMKLFATWQGTPGRFGGYRWWSLSDASAMENISQEGIALHAADGDCELTRRLVKRLARGEETHA
jgi:DNA polymerase-3 subunit epsilon